MKIPKTVQLDRDDVATIYAGLQFKGKIRVSQLGVFSIKRIKPRKFYHNFSGKEIVTQSHNKLHFRPFTKVKEKIQNY